MMDITELTELRKAILNILSKTPSIISSKEAANEIIALFESARTGGLPAPTGDTVSDWARISALHAPQEQAEQAMLDRLESSLGITPNSKPAWSKLARFLIEKEKQGETIEIFATNCKLAPYTTPKAHQIAKDPMLIKANWKHVVAVSAPKDYTAGIPTAEPPMEVREFARLTVIEDVWQRVLDQLKLDMLMGAFNSWVKDTVPISYQDGLFKVKAGKMEAVPWLENRLTSTVTRLLRGILNDPDVRVEFVARDEAER